MALYAISDFHISHAQPKPMDVFGAQWKNHWERIVENWDEVITNEDTVLVPGDISWAMHLEDAKLDIDAIANLPGEKLLMRGNHDYWWSSISKVRSILPENMYALQNDFFPYKGKAICGTRGWICPNEKAFSPDDDKIYNREVGRLELSLSAARRIGCEIELVMFHYPPFNDKQEDNGFLQLLRENGITQCIYGHLHGVPNPFEGSIDGIQFSLVSCDYLEFKPLLLSK